jgi:hypothetical protein
MNLESKDEEEVVVIKNELKEMTKPKEKKPTISSLERLT